MEPITTNTIIATVLSVLSPMIGTDKIIDRNELKCMADNIYFESAAETREGKRAVAHVTMNRAKDSNFPGHICDVIAQGVKEGRKDCQFSWMCDGKKDDIPLTEKDGTTNSIVYKAYYQAVEEGIFAMLDVTPDVTNGATHYYAYKLVKPKWADGKAMIQVAKIEDHVFMAAAPSIYNVYSENSGKHIETQYIQPASYRTDE